MNNIAPRTYDCFAYIINKDILGKDMKEEFEHQKRQNQVELIENGDHKDQFNQMTDFDKFKISMIKYELGLTIIKNLVEIVHFSQLVILRGLNISFLCHFYVSKQFVSSFFNMY